MVTTTYNSVTSSGAYSPLGPVSIVHDLAGTNWDTTIGLTYNPAGQIATRSMSNSSYVWNGAYNVNRGYTPNALNQYATSGAVTLGYDAKGNLTSSGTIGYSYSTKNELTQRSDAGTQFYHDPLGRLDTISGGPSGTTRFQYTGQAWIRELGMYSKARM